MEEIEDQLMNAVENYEKEGRTSDARANEGPLKKKKKERATDEELGQLKVLQDVPLVLSVEFGRTSIPVRRFLELDKNSVISLDKLAGEPIEVLLNGKPIARGEALIINERFGVRLTDIIAPKDSIE